MDAKNAEIQNLCLKLKKNSRFLQDAKEEGRNRERNGEKQCCRRYIHQNKPKVKTNFYQEEVNKFSNNNDITKNKEQCKKSKKQSNKKKMLEQRKNNVNIKHVLSKQTETSSKEKGKKLKVYFLKVFKLIIFLIDFRHLRLFRSTIIKVTSPSVSCDSL